MTQQLEMVFGLRGLQRSIRGRSWSMDPMFRAPWPEKLSRDDLHAAHMDFDLLAQKFREHPDQMLAIQDALVERDFYLATELAAKIGLTEDDFEKRGGGCLYYTWFWLLGMTHGWYGLGPQPPPPPGTNIDWWR